MRNGTRYNNATFDTTEMKQLLKGQLKSNTALQIIPFYFQWGNHNRKSKKDS